MIYMYLKKVNMFNLQVLLCKAVAKFSNFCVYENFFINAQQVDGELNSLRCGILFGSIFLLFFSFNEISQGSIPAPKKADSPGWISILQCFDDLIEVWLHAQTWKSSPKMFSPSFKLVKVLLMHKAWIMSPKNSESETEIE